MLVVVVGPVGACQRRAAIITPEIEGRRIPLVSRRAKFYLKQGHQYWVSNTKHAAVQYQR
jgi:hypothetical protein